MNEEGNSELERYNPTKKPEKTTIKPRPHFFWESLVGPCIHEIERLIDEYV